MFSAGGGGGRGVEGGGVGGGMDGWARDYSTVGLLKKPGLVPGGKVSVDTSLNLQTC